jgi:hypothetical protein
MVRTLLIGAALGLLFGGANTASLRAEIVKLANGDTIHAKVVSIDDKQVVLESEILGRITLPREKVAAVVFGDAALPADAPAGTAPGGVAPTNVKIDPKDSPLDIIKKLVPEGFDSRRVAEMAKDARPAANPDDVIRELREAGGVDPAIRRQLSLSIPGFASPEVQGMFDEKVNGLISGELSLGDIRNEAIEVRDQLEALKKDLGPSGDALNGYLGILNGFIKETESIPAKKPAAKAEPMPGGAK